MATTVHVVPHTHWDREWYLPFQTFRARLVELLDGLVALMADHPDFRFTLDGQLATVDDYLALRPEAEEQVRALIGEGRLAVGPWQILMDEFCVAGETIARNLELGWRRGEQLGGAMPVGYLPDMFGHIAQMPQILRRAGIDRAVVWRGVPAEVDHHAFAWQAPDGSTVRAEYLVGGYGNAAQLFELPDRLPRKLAAFHVRQRSFFGDDNLLAMVGDDHAIPQAAVATLAAGVNAEQADYRVRLATLRDYLDATATALEPLPRWTGEMRSGARANVLMGVTSARVDLKAACARAERGLARCAEPLAALHLPPERWPGELLDLAWRKLVDCSAHDSICGCSADAVVDQVLVRLAEAVQLADTVTERAAAAAGARVRRGGVAVLNPSPVDRADLVALDLPVPTAWDAVALQTPDGTTVATQQLGRDEPLLLHERMPGRRAPDIFDRMHGRELFGRLLNDVAVDRADDRHRVTFAVDRDPDPLWLDVDELREQLEVAVRVAPDEDWDVRILGRPRRRLLARVPAPALGAVGVRALAAEAAPAIADPVRGDRRHLDNGHVAGSVGDDGTLQVRGAGVTLDGVARIVDSGEAGDRYNYAPPPQDRLVDTPGGVRAQLVEAGPLRARLQVERDYRWPVGLAGARRAAAEVDVTVVTRVELRAGEPFVRLRISFDNPVSDHRVRVHLPLPRPVDRSWAEGGYAVVERGVEGEGGHGEHPLPTFPAQAFVAVDGLAVLCDHLTEYEIVAGGNELALTALRAFGLISRNTNPYREDPAGPEVAVPGAQLHGRRWFSFALLPLADRWDRAGVLAAAEAYRHPFVTATGTGEADAPPAAGLSLAGDNVVLHALRRRGEWLEARIVNPQDVPATCVVGEGLAATREADLLGRPGDDLPVEQGRLRLALGPWEIRTVQLRR